MRGRFAGALLLGVVGVAAANAADLAGGGLNGGYGVYTPYAVRMEPMIIYDYEPGVIVRSYWYPPLDNRHYFPRTGRRPRVGRLEHWPARAISKPQEYYRYWSASSVFAPQQIPGRGYGVQGSP
jgi:hypothetical protein